MLKNAFAHWMSLLHPLTDGMDGGGGGGAATGGDAGAGAGTGAGAAAAGTGTPYVLTADSMVDFGDGKPVKWGEATGDNGRYVSRDRYDRGVQYLTAEARRLEGEWAKFHAGSGPKPTQADPNANQPADPMTGLRDRPIISGQDLDGLMRQLYTNGFGPLAQHLTQVIAQNKAMQAQLQGVSQSTGSLNEERQTARFEDDITKTITGIGEIKGLGSLDPKNDTLRELAKDVFLSHEQNSWRPGDFGKALKARVESLFTTFREAQKAEVTRARDAKKNAFFQPMRGNASGQGEPKYQHRSGSELAAAVFGSGIEQPT